MRGLLVDPAWYVRAYHDWNLRKPLLRQERTGAWLGFRALAGSAVARLQPQLRGLITTPT